MVRILKRLLRDTLLNPQTGRFSRKSITSLTFFSLSIVLASVDTFTEIQVKQHYFDAFMAVGQVTLGLTLVGKAIPKTDGKPPVTS